MFHRRSLSVKYDVTGCFERKRDGITAFLGCFALGYGIKHVSLQRFLSVCFLGRLAWYWVTFWEILMSAQSRSVSAVDPNSAPVVANQIRLKFDRSNGYKYVVPNFLMDELDDSQTMSQTKHNAKLFLFN